MVISLAHEHATRSSQAHAMPPIVHLRPPYGDQLGMRDRATDLQRAEQLKLVAPLSRRLAVWARSASIRRNTRSPSTPSGSLARDPRSRVEVSRYATHSRPAPSCDLRRPFWVQDELKSPIATASRHWRFLCRAGRERLHTVLDCAEMAARQVCVRALRLAHRISPTSSTLASEAVRGCAALG